MVQMECKCCTICLELKFFLYIGHFFFLFCVWIIDWNPTKFVYLCDVWGEMTEWSALGFSGLVTDVGDEHHHCLPSSPPAHCYLGSCW